MDHSDWLVAFRAAEDLPPGFAGTVERVHLPVADRIAAQARPGELLIVGICGAQGSGKSTMASVLAHLLEARGLGAATLSIDDLYLPRADRERLAAEVHPLLATRGVPGTHDVALGMELFDAIQRRQPVALPRFDKGRDDRRPVDEWPRVERVVDVLLFEGWCVGARPQPEAELVVPVNELERGHDADATWRRHVNEALAGPYARLFGRIGLLVLIEAPGFDAVLGWRVEQERKLRARLAGMEGARIMSDADVARFVAHYERLTRHMLAEMPARADILVRLDAQREAELVRSGLREAGGGQAWPAAV